MSRTQNPETRTSNLQLTARALFTGHWSFEIGLLLLAFALRLYRLDAQSIWVDEGISLHLATSSLAEIVANRAANIHPPLYFFLLKAWVALTDTNIFSARFFSVLSSLLQVVVIYVVARRWIGRPTARVAALLTALSPLSVIYAQEIRAYALLPLVYLALLAITHELTQKPGPHRRATWLLLGTVEVSGLYLHYVVLFLIAYAGSWSFLAFWRKKRWADLRSWWITQLLVGLASLPWLIAVLAHWTAVQAEAQAGTALAHLPPLNYLLAQIWVFHLTGLAGAVGRPAMQLLAGITVLFLAVLLLLRLAQPTTRRPVARLAAHWLIPLGSALLVWIVRPFSHPRYIALYAPGLTLLVAYAIHPSKPKSQTPDASRFTQHASRFTFHVSRITFHVSRITPHVSRFTHHVSRFTHHVSRFTFHASRTTLAISLLLISLLGLRAYFFDPALAKDDVRGVARYLEEEAGPNDLVLIPDGDWSLTFVYHGKAPIEMPRLSEEDRMWADLARWTADRQRAFAMGYWEGIGTTQQRIIPFALEKAGTLTTRRSFDGPFVSTYHLDRPVEPPTPAPLDGHFGPLILTQGWVEAEAPADTALTLALRWHLHHPPQPPLPGGETSSVNTSRTSPHQPPLPGGESREGGVQRYGLTIRLLDVDGWPLAILDSLLLDGQGRPTDLWPEEHEITTYHVLPIPPGTPPLTYTLTLGLYEQTESGPRPLDLLDDQGAPQGQWKNLATVHLTAPVGITGNPYRTTNGPPPLPQPADLAAGLQLIGASLDHSTLSPGQSLFATLHWQATRSPLPALRPRLAMVQADQEISAVESAPALGRYPTDRWQAGEMVIEHRRLVVPPTAAEGPADVVLTLGNQRLTLGRIEIIAQEHAFTPPAIAYPLDVRFGQVARFIGYDLPPQTFTAAEPITLTLYWQALEGIAGTDYTVFTHILAADGHMVGQHDGPPAEGTRPTLGWVPGEIITDRHVMTFREPYVGPVRIEVGLYDPATMERVPMEEGETFVLLPTAMTILER